MTTDRSAADHYEALALASSAGGIHARTVALGALGPDLPVPALVVRHLDPRHRTVIAEVLGRRTALRVKLAENGERARPGTVHIAPPTGISWWSPEAP
ncbi:chemotaxis protein CheB [Streptomyces sp. NPDC018045]|uniref:chemotaxis protein CheB n=1 Tax=Streptomyces sp. NPDC018045 TaxID=3365037 RepID=UPI003788C5C6